MILPLIPTTVIGSLPKPAWLTGEWYSVVERWNLSGAALKEAMDDATRLALADQEVAGIDIVCDGEQRRSTHYTHFIHQLGGVDSERLKAKSMRGGKFTQEVPRVTGPITLATHQAVDDYRFLRRLTNRTIKMTLPGPSTLVDGMADDYYGDERALALACADALNQEIRALAAAGCDMVQLDEPAFTRLPEKLHAWGVEAMDRAFAGTTVTSCVHVCYGYRARLGNKEWKYGYEEIFPALCARQGRPILARVRRAEARAEAPRRPAGQDDSARRHRRRHRRSGAARNGRRAAARGARGAASRAADRRARLRLRRARPRRDARQAARDGARHSSRPARAGSPVLLKPCPLPTPPRRVPRHPSS